ncbi:MAG TPA: hypothetical protein VIX87_00780 [Steroidobacteraceae bacterium]
MPVFVLSVDGGSVENNADRNMIEAVAHARARGAKVLGILARDGGYTATAADAVVIVLRRSEPDCLGNAC